MTGEIVTVTYENKDTKFCILTVNFLTPHKKGGVLKGTVMFTPGKGRNFEAEVEETYDKKYGLQYKAIGPIREAAIVSDKGMITYLVNEISGVGEKKAKDIVQFFGANQLKDIMANNPERLYEMPGIGPGLAKKISDSWKESENRRELIQFLGGFDVGPRTIAKIQETFGGNAINVIKENPYMLVSVRGIGFKTADSIALASGIVADSMNRIHGALNYLFDESLPSNGDTAIAADKVVPAALKLLGDINKERVALCLQEMLAEEKLISRATGDGVIISTARVVKAEKSIAEDLFRLQNGCIKNPKAEAISREVAKTMKDPDQARAIENAFNHGISIVTGRPGCGKTTITKQGLEVAIRAGYKENQIVFCAPTGKAARRLTQATGFKARTMHSTLGFRDGKFIHNAENPIPGSIFFVDEKSMVDMSIARSFYAAIPTGARVIMVGDDDQLPSVGAGNVLRDLIHSGVIHVSTLRTIHRTALDSDIVINAHHVINGDIKAFDFHGDKDFVFNATDADNEPEITNRVVQRFIDLSIIHGADNVQVLASRHGTECGVEVLNRRIRESVNPATGNKADELNAGGMVFRRHDKIMQTVNDNELGVSNGEVGSITSIDHIRDACLVDLGDDRQIFAPKQSMGSFDLAYATTIHKSQGSEYKAVIIVSANSHSYMMNRNLLYTAITRGKQYVELIGSKKAICSAINKPGNERTTGLAHEVSTRFDCGRKPVVKRKLF